MAKEKLPRTIVKTKNQVGNSVLEVDIKRYALEPGKRISKNRNLYWETRKNRSDKEGTMV